MKRGEIISFIFLFSLVILFSGYKDPKADSRVKTVTTLSNAVTTVNHYCYDSLGRCAYNWYDGGDTAYFFYEKNKVIQKSNQSVMTFTLNNKGYIIDLDGITNTYDDSDYLIKTDDGRITKSILTISNGDIIKAINIQIYDSAIQNCDSAILSYYQQFDTRNYGLPTYGRENIHLLKIQRIYSSKGGYMTSYTYSFDELGRVKKETTKTSTSVWVHTYTYY
jgi:hypothetical protein